MPGWTNRGKYQVLGGYLRGESAPTNFYIVLLTNDTPPTADTKTMSQVSEIAAGNGYVSGGQQLSKNATDFDTWTEDDVNDRAFVQLRDVTWTASGGPLPASGNGARWAALTDDNASVAAREVFYYWDLEGADQSVTDGQPLTLQDSEIRLNET